MNRTLLIVGLPLLLGGCLPVPLQIASTGLSAFALVASGKSTTDHVLSATVKEDCAMYRVLIMQSPCRAYPDGVAPPETVTVQHYPGDQEDWQIFETDPLDNPEIAEALDEPTGDAVPFDPEIRLEPASAPVGVDAGAADDLLVSSFAPARGFSGIDVDTLLASASPADGDFLPVAAPRVVARRRGEGPILTYTYDRSRPPTFEVAAEASSATLVDPVAGLVEEASGDRYVVLGSFRTLERAQTLKQRSDALRADIVTISIEGAEWHRVVVGPFTPEMATRVADDYRSTNATRTWVTRM